jgi:tetratricopeptide (TPR) repeat protein
MYQVIVILLLWTVSAGAAPQKTPAQIARAGWDALNAGRPQDAAGAFDQALLQRPADPEALLGAGLAAHLLGHGDQARRFLLDALKVEPSLTAASLLLGEVLYRANDLNGAIDIYQQALALAPGQRQLVARLETWRRELALHERFAQKLGDHFTVLFEGPAEAALAARAVDVLEAAYWRIGSILYTYPTDVITVVLYTREQFRDITRSPEWAAGAYDGRIRVPVLGATNNPREFERVLAHEFTHALVRSLAPTGVPQWLNEGLAMYFDGSAPMPVADREQAQESGLDLKRLEQPFTGLDDAAAVNAYRQSAAAVRLLLTETGPPAIVGLLTDLGRGLPFPEAFERNTNISYADFQKRR